MQFLIDARCENSRNSLLLSGTYKDVGGFGDYAVYEKQTIDDNGNCWYFYYDTTKSGWNFISTDVRVVPGVTSWVSPWDKDRPGQSSNIF